MKSKHYCVICAQDGSTGVASGYATDHQLSYTQQLLVHKVKLYCLYVRNADVRVMWCVGFSSRKTRANALTRKAKQQNVYCKRDKL